jgi:hypothetical protein
MKLWIIFVKFLFIGALFIVSNENLYLKDGEDLNKFTELYVSWLSQIYTHAGQITGYVINSEWLPHNEDVSIFETR